MRLPRRVRPNRSVVLRNQERLNKYLGMPNFSPLLAAVGLAGVLAKSAGGQAPSPPPAPLVTDRPDQTESATIVPRGTVQLEVGGTHAFDEAPAGGASRSVNLGAALARVGLARAVELRLAFDGWHRASPDGEPAVHGVGDLAVGAKVQLIPGAGARPAVALLGGVTLPTGHQAFGAEGIDPDLRLAMAHELPGGFGLGYNLGAQWTTETDPAGDESLRTDLIYTVVASRTVTDRLGLFSEAFGLFGVGDGRPSWHSLDAGLTLGVGPTVQLDLSAGLGLTDAADDWFVGAGISLRVPR